MTFRGRYDSTDLLFKELNILKFDLLIKYCITLTIYKNVNDSDANNKIFSMFHHGRGTRGDHQNLICPRPRTTLYKHSVHCVGPNVWNTLPDDVKKCCDFNLFKSRMKNYLFNVLNQDSQVYFWNLVVPLYIIIILFLILLECYLSKLCRRM